MSVGIALVFCSHICLDRIASCCNPLVNEKAGVLCGYGS